MKQDLAALHKRLRLPFWQRADIEAELASHLAEVTAELRAQGVPQTEARRVAVERLGNLAEVAAELQEIHHDWFGGVTVQQRFTKIAVVAVILLCLLAIPLVPQLREMFRMTNSPMDYPSRQALMHTAQAHPNDPYFQLALAEDTLARTTVLDINGAPIAGADDIKPGDLTGLRQLAERFPNSPVVQLHLALKLLDESGESGRVEELRNTEEDNPPTKRSPDQQTKLNDAISYLRAAATLAPDNATPSYFLAYALYANNQDEAAEAALRSAGTKPVWSFYSNELLSAWLALYEQSGASSVNVPMFVESLDTANEFIKYARLRSLARIITSKADAYRNVADDQRALAYYEAALRLGDTLSTNATSVMEGLVGASIVQITSSAFISEADRARLEQLAKTTREQANAQRVVIRARNFQSYLTGHGRADLAQRYGQDIAAAKRFKVDSKALMQKNMGRVIQAFSSPGLLRAWMAWLQLGYLFALLVIVGIVSLILRWWRERGLVPQWQWWEWGVIAAISFLPAYLIRLPAPVDTANLPEEVASGASMPGESILMVGLIAAVLFLILAIAGSLLKRRHLPAAARLGAFRSVLASFRTLLPPTFAVLLILALVMTVFAQMTVQQWSDQQKQILKQGEVRYWKIGAPPEDLDR